VRYPAVGPVNDAVSRGGARTLVESLYAAAEIHGGEDAFVVVRPSGDERITYRRLTDRVEGIARHLIRLELGRGERIVLAAGDPERFICIFLGAQRAGLVPVPAAPPATVQDCALWARATGRILRTAGARALVVDEGLTRVGPWLRQAIGSDFLFLSAVELEGAPGPPLPALNAMSPPDLALIQFTSGSTADPKGIPTTHAALIANSDTITHDVLRMRRRQDVAVGWLPLHHDMGLVSMLVGPIRMGCASVVMSPIDFAKRPARWLGAASAHRGTITFAPSFAYDLVTRRPPALDGLDLSSLRVIGCGAERIRPDTLRRFVRYYASVGVRHDALVPCYGMAESVVGIALSTPGEGMLTECLDRKEVAHGFARKVARESSAAAVEIVCCGRALPGHEVEVVDDSGGVLPDRHIGEFRVRGPSVAAEYFEDPVASATTFTAMGLLTGDLGYLDNGLVFVTARRKDLVIVEGRNHAPSDIEEAVERLPGVRPRSVVAFSSDGPFGEELVVVLEPELGRQAGKPDPDAVRSAIQREFSLPLREVAIVSPGAIPRTTSGKLRRAETRQRYERGTLRSHPGYPDYRIASPPAVTAKLE
jgi:fatty-acyl-CoA synthase